MKGARLIRRLFRGQEGFIATTLGDLFIDFLLVLLLMLFVVFISASKKGYETYGLLDAALNYAVASANVNGSTGTLDDEEEVINGTNVAQDSDTVTQYFIEGFSKLTDSTYSGGKFHSSKFPDAIELLDLRRVEIGDPIPPEPAIPGMPQLSGAVAEQPGYVVYASVPVWHEGWLDLPGIRISMKVYRVIQAVPVEM